MQKQKLDVSPCELTLLSSSIAIAIAEAYEFEDVCLLRAFFQSIAANLTLIENTCRHNDKQKSSAS